MLVFLEVVDVEEVREVVETFEVVVGVFDEVDVRAVVEVEVEVEVEVAFDVVIDVVETGAPCPVPGTRYQFFSGS